MDSRQHPRVQLPFEVELAHPSLGRIRRVVRDVSQGGLFVVTDTGTLKPGAKIKVTVLSAALVESTATPTIDMEVARVDPRGLGLKFVNSTGEFLWSSVQRLRQELEIGRDYFQVFQGALVFNREGRLLVVQQHGKWLFPGEHLVVGQDWRTRMSAFLTTEFGLEEVVIHDVLAVDSDAETQAGENATFSVFHRVTTEGDRAQLRAGSRYKQTRWVARSVGVDELTFSHPLLRRLASLGFERTEAERRPTPAPAREPVLK
jgi:hypothetical protein